MANIEMNFSANGNSTQNNKIEVNFVYLVISPLGIQVTDDYQIAEEMLKVEKAFNENSIIQKKVLFTKEVY